MTAEARRTVVLAVVAAVLAAALTSWVVTSLVDDDEAGSGAPPAPAPGPAGGGGAGQTWANVKRFGARGDGSTDDTAAIQKAIDSLAGKEGRPQGGTVYFPRGSYNVKRPLDADGSVGLVMQGDGSPTPGYNFLPASVVTYTGGAARSFISARSSNGFTVRGLALKYSSKEFEGSLIDLGHTSAKAIDSAYATFQDCLISGTSTTSAAALVSFRYAILSSVRNCHLGWGKVGVKGRARGPEGNGYANAIAIEGVTFDNFTTAAIMNAGEGWSISDSWFEGTDAGTGGMPRAYYDDLPKGAATFALSFTGNWFGDAGAVKDAWIDSGPNTIINGLSLSGNFFSGGARAVSLKSNAQGISITGNHLGTTRAGVDLGTAIKEGVSITGNSFPPAPIPGVVGTAGHRNLRVTANSR
jgi:hypothetical protein